MAETTNAPALKPEDRTAQIGALTANIADELGPQFAGIFQKGYENLGQSRDPNIRALSLQRARDASQQFANIYADEYLKLTGTLPTKDQITQFVGGNINSGFATRFIEGNVSDAQKRGLATEAIGEDTTAQGQATGGAKSELQRLQDESLARQNQALEEQYKSALELGTQDVNEQANVIRKRAIEDQMALGRLTSPVGQKAITQADTERQRTLGNLIAQLRGQKAGALASASQNALAQSIQQQQFGQELGLKKKTLAQQIQQYQDQLDYSRSKDREERDLAMKLGQMKAEASKPGVLDFVNTGIGGLSALANVAKVGSSWMNRKPGE